jgi:hypothetical protein
VQGALVHTECVSHLAAGIAQLLQADDAGGGQQTLDFDQSVREAVEDWSPVASEAGKKFSLHCDCAVAVQFVPRRLREGLFHLLEFALLSMPPGGVVEVETQKYPERVELGLEFPRRRARKESGGAGPEGEQQELRLRLGLAISRRMFAAAGGDWQAGEVGGRQRIRVRLPRES